jgi:hypothetical protein
MHDTQDDATTYKCEKNSKLHKICPERVHAVLSHPAKATMLLKMHINEYR